MFLDGDLAVAEHGEERGLAGPVGADEPVPLPATQLQLGVLEQLGAVEGDGKVVDLDVPGHGVDAKDPSTGPSFGGEPSFFVKATTQLLCNGIKSITT